MKEVVVVRTGVANLASVLAGLERAGTSPRLSESPEDVRAAEYLVVPGVGAFGAAVEQLQKHALVQALQERVRNGDPTLAVCVGMQVLARDSEESPGVAGLSVFDGSVERFGGGGIRVPQLGWNEIVPDAQCQLLQPGFAYFANSYRLQAVPEGWHGATAEHGGPFVAALERGRVLACQFHPELSGAWGLNLLQRWLHTPLC